MINVGISHNPSTKLNPYTLCVYVDGFEVAKMHYATEKEAQMGKDEFLLHQLERTVRLLRRIAKFNSSIDLSTYKEVRLD